MTIPARETKIIDKTKFACDGNDPASGHPRVWLAIPEDKGWVDCPYCDTKYVHGTEIDDALKTG